MSDAARYALYYVPSSVAPLYKFGAALLGYDSFTGRSEAVPGEVEAAFADWHDLTRAPRPYGFHATLKAPFALAAPRGEAELRAACADFAAQPRVLPVMEPVVSLVGSFVAVVPANVPEALTRLAAECVETFDAFRAPLTASDRARRNPAALSARQVAHLDRWGYPYVMDEFRFHMTLTGRLPPDRQASVLAMLRERFAAIGCGRCAVDRLVLLRQEAGALFRVVEEWTLRGT